jgi:hypothetical protein
MKLIGIKRIIILAILIALNSAIAAAYFLWIEPMRGEAQVKLNATKSEISKLQGKIQNTKVELREYETNLPKYKELEARGFMSSQDRFQITRDLEAVRARAALAGFGFQIADLQTVNNDAAREANMKVLNSRISVDNIGTLLDIDFYEFIDLMLREFPSHVRLQSFAISRKQALNAPTLNKIATEKGNVPLVSSKAVFDWLTYVPMLPSEIPAQNQRRRR